MDQLLAQGFVLTNSKGNQYFKTGYMKYMMDCKQTFDTKWSVASIRHSSNEIISVEYDTDIYNDYFYNGKMNYQYTYSFNGNCISGLNVQTLPGDDELLANFHNRFKKFTERVSLNYPAKTGFCTKKDK